MACGAKFIEGCMVLTTKSSCDEQLKNYIILRETGDNVIQKRAYWHNLVHYMRALLLSLSDIHGVGDLY